MVIRDDKTSAAGRARFLAYGNAEEWAFASAVALAAELRRALERQPRARLLLSGGKTPAPVYQALSHTVLDWARVDVGLVDERWLQPDDPDSNARLVRETLLQDKAAVAAFESMTRAGRNIDDVVSTANLHAKLAPTVLTLGMGDDGHTASLFPRMRGFEQAIANRSAYVAVDASGCPGAGAWHRRISLTPAGIAAAETRLLLIRGEAKRDLFERALAGGDVAEMPIRIAIGMAGAPLQVHWCP